jgi:hypothetical protein
MHGITVHTPMKKTTALMILGSMHYVDGVSRMGYGTYYPDGDTFRYADPFVTATLTEGGYKIDAGVATMTVTDDLEGNDHAWGLVLALAELHPPRLKYIDGMTLEEHKDMCDIIGAVGSHASLMESRELYFPRPVRDEAIRRLRVPPHDYKFKIAGGGYIVSW